MKHVQLTVSGVLLPSALCVEHLAEDGWHDGCKWAGHRTQVITEAVDNYELVREWSRA